MINKKRYIFKLKGIFGMGNIQWFPMYVDNDPALDGIEREFGQVGFAVVVQMFRYIYHGKKGYYCELNDEVLSSFVDKLRMDSRLTSEGCRSSGWRRVSEILKSCVKRGIFHTGLFEKYGILTSADLQKNYLRAVKRRQSAEIDARFMLISATDLPKNVKIIGELYDNSEKMYDNENTHNMIDDIIVVNSADGVGKKDSVNEERSIVSYYLQVINPNISKSICDILVSYQADGMSYECMKAILDDCRNDNHLNWSYISKVLSLKFNSGIRTLADYRKDCENFQAAKLSGGKPKGKREYRVQETFHRVEL